MKVSGVHWLLFFAIMFLAVACGEVLADHYLTLRDKKWAEKQLAGTDQ